MNFVKILVELTKVCWKMFEIFGRYADIDII